MHMHVSHFHSSEVDFGTCAPAPHPVNLTFGATDTGLDAGFGVSHTSHLVEVALLVHIHVEHFHMSPDAA